MKTDSLVSYYIVPFIYLHSGTEIALMTRKQGQDIVIQYYYTRPVFQVKINMSIYTTSQIAVAIEGLINTKSQPRRHPDPNSTPSARPTPSLALDPSTLTHPTITTALINNPPATSPLSSSQLPSYTPHTHLPKRPLDTCQNATLNQRTPRLHNRPFLRPRSSLPPPHARRG